MQYNKSMNKRKDTYSVEIGNIKIGSKHPIRVQSMTNTDTSDVDKTVNQIMQLSDAGSELVRVTVNDEKSAKSVEKIKSILLQNNYSVPIVGDFHFNGHTLLEDHQKMAKILDKYRINPGNCDYAKDTDNNFTKFIKIAIKHNIMYLFICNTLKMTHASSL